MGAVPYGGSMILPAVFPSRSAVHSSVRGHTAVDHQFAAGDPRGLIGGEVKTARGNIGRRSEPAEWRRLYTPSRDLRIGVTGPGHRRVDEAWVHRVHANLIWCILDRGGLGENPYSPLRRVISGVGM